MDFGALPQHRAFDLSLAPLDASDVGRLSGSPAADAKLHIGAPQWNVPSWVGHCYPKKTKTDDYLPEYVKQWNSIELNSSFYRNPSPEQVRKWLEKSRSAGRDDFCFYVKVFQGLSHDPSFWADPATMAQKIETFIECWQELESMWKGSFLQLPPEFSLHDFGKLERWISFWPKSHPLHVEFRHPSWFQERKLVPRARDLLAERKVGLLITDTPGRRDVSHGTITLDRYVVRFLGQTTIEDTGIFKNDLDRLDAWAKRIAGLFSRGLKECALFMHTPELHATPELARYFSERFKVYAQEFGVDIPVEVPRKIAEPQMGFGF